MFLNLAVGQLLAEEANVRKGGIRVGWRTSDSGSVAQDKVENRKLEKWDSISTLSSLDLFIKSSAFPQLYSCWKNFLSY